MKLMGGSGETYQYLTESYTTGAVASITAATVEGNAAANWNTSSPDLNAGDKFILDGDHSAAVEPDTHWAQLSSITDDDTLVLTANYAGTAGSGNYKIRKVYSCPSGERWQFASVNGKFCFVNGNVYGQYWNGTDTYATRINTTYINQARYCVAFANRLVTADMQVSGSRNPWYLRWSKEGDPTDWTDTTAGFVEFMDSEEPITGLGCVGEQLVVFRKTAYHLGYRTGEPSSPLAFDSPKRGIGLYAPYSLVHVAGTVAWMGLNDFYFLNGKEAESIGEPIRKKFFELVADDELESVFGVSNPRYHEVLWVANTSSGQYTFSYNWQDKTWGPYQFSNNITGFGGWGGV
jgi:hypothetical protein